VDLKLNKYQKEAIQNALKNDLFLIHGPFGTGKTTVLVYLILELIKRGKKILVTADSNTAVDNIVEKLSKYTENFVRIGNPSKIMEKNNIFKYSLEEIIKKEDLFKKVKELKEKLDKLEKKRSKYLKPTPSLRRGLTNEQIFKYAFIGRSARGISIEKIKSMANWLRIDKEYKLIKEEYDLYLKKLIEKVLEEKQVILTTNSSSALEILENKFFDYLIHDEASQSTEPSSLIPLIKAKKVVFAGDHKQLPPTVLSEDDNLKYSLFERLIDLKKPNYQLKIQYRMNEVLMEFPNKLFYNNTLIADESVKNIKLSDLLDEKIKKKVEDNPFLNDHPLIFVDVDSKEKISISKSKFNLDELKAVKNCLKDFKNVLDLKLIGLITPYKEQYALFKKELKGFIEKGLEISTIDGFQGKEKDIILLSLVRANEKGEIGFLKDYRRLNVAITRAKRKLIVFGNSETLESDNIYRKWINFIKKKGKIIEI